MSSVRGSSWKPIPKMVRCICGALVFERDRAKHVEEAHGKVLNAFFEMDRYFVEPENPKPEDMKRKKR